MLRDALHLMEERERRLSTLDAAIAHGLADIEAGRVHDAATVSAALDADLAVLPDTSE